MVDLQIHSFRLATVLREIDENLNGFVEEDGVSLASGAEWFEMAAGIETVKLITGRFDESLAWCGKAMDYEDKRSVLLSQLVTRLSIFNFIWGGFESVAKVITGKKDRIVDSSIDYLMSAYDPTPAVKGYSDEVWKLRRLMLQSSYYKGIAQKEFRLRSQISSTGIGLHVTRKIRNQFAHGAHDMPSPEDWGGADERKELTDGERINIEIIDSCSRLILLTMQMMLRAYLSGKEIHVTSLQGESGFSLTMHAEIAVIILHRDRLPESGEQIPLFRPLLRLEDEVLTD